MFSDYFKLTKSGIVFFVILSGLAGYALGYDGQGIEWLKLILSLTALYGFSSGSFAINQAQEWTYDIKMPRTSGRPIPMGKITSKQAFLAGIFLIVLGTIAGSFVSSQVVLLGLLTVFLYNGLYTLYWKRHWSFGAVPGAIPGAMPVVIGYAASSGNIFTSECIYSFLIMFLWQMPHFWSLAIKYQDDYAKGGFPVLPTKIGTHATLFHIGLYVFAYLGLALASPWLIITHYAYLFLVLPFVFMVGFEFARYYKSHASKSWLAFFLWTNFSMLAFLLAPVIDKWQKVL